jgi:hypothetical protein
VHTTTGSHVDYYRELSTGFDYIDKDRRSNQIAYSMQRTKSRQAEPVTLTLMSDISQFAETGCEGNHLQRIQLSEEQELNVLGVIQAIGGISVVAS